MNIKRPKSTSIVIDGIKFSKGKTYTSDNACPRHLGEFKPVMYRFLGFSKKRLMAKIYLLNRFVDEDPLISRHRTQIWSLSKNGDGTYKVASVRSSNPT